ncbi:glycine--tRNA ligase subunit beta [Propionispora sp. 2/2-37]|uniref:glycine--tRNA ligase subunit beta n=1 Tax=Propionispora sp. 2/2-37 TaxID=1677858 RepID=UPI0006BB720B|nr:glycine--tRNA ligase subunit beta [Propionispora sp. 2/2-37]
MSRDLLLEIGTEEIPARFMPDILFQLEKLSQEKLALLRITYKQVQAIGTPRRMVLVIRGLSEQQEDKFSENKGPSVKIAFDSNGAPTKAAQGFARGQGVDVTELVVKDGYVYAAINESGRPVQELLPEILLNIIHSLNFPKNMRWGDLDIRFVRPIRWLVALYGTEIIPLSIAEVSSGNVTYGHRFLSKGALTIGSVDDYFEKLAKNYVMVDPKERRAVILHQVEQLAISHGGVAEIDGELLEEVVFLVEFPTALCGNFDEKYLTLPAEAIITPMREHQRYFPVLSKDKRLLPVFITVRNGNSDHIKVVQHGNERVLRARLDDAKFFFEEDQKITLENRVEKLKTIVFQEGLGTLYDKTLRIQALSSGLAEKLQLTGEIRRIIDRSAYLSKADLVTGMVYEFTELQGVMGREYALINGEDPCVAAAIFEHYLPRFSGDELPPSDAGRIISISDKLDNIVATFSRGLIPSGSQDPYALRRQALGIAYIVIQANYSVSLQQLVELSMDLLHISEEKQRKQLSADIQDFFRLRIKNILTEAGIRYDVIDAVMAAGTDDMYDTWLRAKALADESLGDAIRKAALAFTRIANLTKNNKVNTIVVNPELLAALAEYKLFEVYGQSREKIEKLLKSKQYAGAITVMADLADSIDAFFSEVMVMVEDPAVRNNRLALLKVIADLTAKTADFSKIIA